MHGDLDPPGAAHLESVLTDLINSQDEVSLIVDLHDAREADGDGLSVFATAAGLAEARGGTLVLSSPPEAIQTALEAAGVAQLIRRSRDGRKLRAGSGSEANGRGAHPAGGGVSWSGLDADHEDPAG